MTQLLTVFKNKSKPESPSIIRSASRDSATWEKPVFKAPPLNVLLPQSADANFYTRSEGRSQAGR
jgi:hypothetical protein